MSHQFNMIDEIHCVENRKQLEELLQRKVAEFENYKNRTQKEKQEIGEYANASLLFEYLNVLDMFEKYREWVSTQSKDDEHIVQLNNALYEVITREGVTKMNTNIGDKFDVDMHEAMMREDSEYEENHITKVLQYGYIYKDKVLRYAKVVVSG